MKNIVLAVVANLVSMHAFGFEKTNPNFNKLLEVFQKPTIIGDCRVWYSGNDDASADFWFQKPYRSNPTPSNMLLTPPENTGGRSKVDSIENGFRYLEDGVFGWTIMEVHTNKSGRAVHLEIYNADAFENKIGNSKLICRAKGFKGK